MPPAAVKPMPGCGCSRAAAGLLFLALRRLPALAPARIATLYVIGGLAAYWSIELVATILA